MEPLTGTCYPAQDICWIRISKWTTKYYGLETKDAFPSEIYQALDQLFNRYKRQATSSINNEPNECSITRLGFHSACRHDFGWLPARTDGLCSVTIVTRRSLKKKTLGNRSLIAARAASWAKNPGQSQLMPTRLHATKVMKMTGRSPAEEPINEAQQDDDEVRGLRKPGNPHFRLHRFNRELFSHPSRRVAKRREHQEQKPSSLLTPSKSHRGIDRTQ